MSKRAAIGVALGVVVSVWAGGGLVWAQAQEAALAKPVPAPMPCSRPVNRCMPAESRPHWLHNNLVQDGNVCRFELGLGHINMLRVDMGSSVNWTICNSCNVDMIVQLDTNGADGPFGNRVFQSFNPASVGADNKVQRVVPCHSESFFFGSAAQQAGSWKYSLRAGPASAPGTFPENIDPELVIDDSHGFHKLFGDWGKPLMLLIVGLIIGYYVAMKRPKARMNQ